jgi:hypothetical protein
MKNKKVLLPGINFERDLPADCLEKLNKEVLRRGGDPSQPSGPMMIDGLAAEVLEAEARKRGISELEMVIEMIRAHSNCKPRTKPKVRRYRKP